MSQTKLISRKEEEVLRAIRNHPEIGEGSCASIDECYSDSELLDEIRVKLTRNPYLTNQQIIDSFVDDENDFRSYAEDIMGTAF